MTNLQFTGATILDRGVLSKDVLSILGGKIGTSGSSVRAVDLTDYVVLPGIIDLHGDGFERHLAPRRGVALDKRRALVSVEAELAAHGITTAWLAQFWSWEGGMRAPVFARELATALTGYNAQLDLRLQLRLETHMVDDLPDVADFVRAAGIDYVVLNDHLPHKALANGKRPKRLTGSALKSGRSPEAHLALMQIMTANADRVPVALRDFVASLPDVRFGSHDDPERETRDWFEGIGADICEFPTTSSAANGLVVMGAPNVVRGGSQAHNVAAQDVISAGLCDALASDYHYPSPMLSAYALADRGVLSFAQAWALLSENPARIMGLSDRGVLQVGKRADLVIVHEASRRVEAVFANGAMVYLTGGAAQRFLG